MARKGQIITLKTALLMDSFKGYAVGEDWIVISGGAITVAAPMVQNHSLSHTDEDLLYFFHIHPHLSLYIFHLIV